MSIPSNTSQVRIASRLHTQYFCAILMGLCVGKVEKKSRSFRGVMRNFDANICEEDVGGLMVKTCTLGSAPPIYLYPGDL